MILTVYTSGSIKKGNESEKRKVWTDIERDEVRKGAFPHEVRFFNPDDPVPKLDQALPMFGRDMYQVKIADFVIVDAREKRGIGVGIEMLASRVFETPLIVVAPANTHYRRDKIVYRGGLVENYIHPHLAILADTVVDSFIDAGSWMIRYKNDPYKIKGIDELHIATNEYVEQVFEFDTYMKKALENIDVSK